MTPNVPSFFVGQMSARMSVLVSKAFSAWLNRSRFLSSDATPAGFQITASPEPFSAVTAPPMAKLRAPTGRRRNSAPSVRTPRSLEPF